MVQALARTERRLAIFIVLFACLHLYLVLSNAYWRHSWLDMPMHFLGGLWFGFFGGYYLFDCGRIAAKRRLHEALVIISFVSLICVLWEFHEFIGDRFVRDSSLIMQTSLRDTMSDLLLGMAGGTMAVILRIIPWQRHSQSPEERS